MSHWIKAYNRRRQYRKKSVTSSYGASVSQWNGALQRIIRALTAQTAQHCEGMRRHKTNKDYRERHNRMVVHSNSPAWWWKGKGKQNGIPRGLHGQGGWSKKLGKNWKIKGEVPQIKGNWKAMGGLDWITVARIKLKMVSSNVRL